MLLPRAWMPPDIALANAPRAVQISSRESELGERRLSDGAQKPHMEAIDAQVCGRNLEIRRRSVQALEYQEHWREVLKSHLAWWCLLGEGKHALSRITGTYLVDLLAVGLGNQHLGGFARLRC